MYHEYHIYINVMTHFSNKVNIILLADDNILIFKSDNTIDLEHIMQEYLDLLYEMAIYNHIVYKSTAIIFNFRNSLSSIRLNITINNIILI